MPLTLGGSDCSTINLTAYSDASSLATGPKRRSITGVLVKLHPQSGAIMASTHATIGIRTSSFVCNPPSHLNLRFSLS
eukprot:scaffold6902_cov217-Ochromonas_danica.AAC.2